MSEDFECPHGFSDVAFCFDCNGGKVVHGIDAPFMKARFETMCKGGCETTIRIGQRIFRIDDEWVCRACAERAS